MPKRKQPKVIIRKLGKEKAWGQFIEDENIIEIDPRLRGKHKLEIYLHELYHWFNPKATEEEVIRFQKEFGNFLWRHNLRFVENHAKQP